MMDTALTLAAPYRPEPHSSVTAGEPAPPPPPPLASAARVGKKRQAWGSRGRGELQKFVK